MKIMKERVPMVGEGVEVEDVDGARDVARDEPAPVVAHHQRVDHIREGFDLVLIMENESKYE